MLHEFLALFSLVFYVVVLNKLIQDIHIMLLLKRLILVHPFYVGSSWAAVLEKRESLRYPADLYLEGTDQHRGWFQSSLLTSIATKGKEVSIHRLVISKLEDEKDGFYLVKMERITS